MLARFWGGGRIQPYCSHRYLSMTRRNHSMRPRHRLSRRMMLRRLAAIASFAAGVRSSLADDSPLDALMGDVDRGGFGQGFDQASRTVHMPKATIPMLSPGTAEATRRAVEVYDRIVARGGWPEVSKVMELRLGTQHASVGELRSRSQFRAISIPMPAPSRTTSMIPISGKRCVAFRRVMA